MAKQPKSADLKGLKAGDELSYLDIFVHKSLAEDAFVVGDSTDSIVMDLSEKPEFTKQVSPGKCFRLPKPILKGGKLLLAERFGPCPIKPFTVEPLADFNDFELETLDPMDFVTLDQVANIDTDTTIPILYLKVVFLSTEQKGKYSMYKTALVKDIKCQRHFLRLYGDIRLDVQVGHVFN